MSSKSIPRDASDLRGVIVGHMESSVNEIGAMTKKSPYEIREALKAASGQLPRLNLLAGVMEKVVNEIIQAIRSGANVPAERLARLVRDGCPLPQDVREYIAGRLDGSIKPKGRPVAHLGRNAAASKAFIAALVRRKDIRNKYRIEHAANRQLKKDDPAAYRKLCKNVGRVGATPEQLTYAMLAFMNGETYDVIRNAVKRAPKK